MNAPSHFRSPLAAEIERFLAHHRALGKRFDSEEHALRLFDRFLAEHGVKALGQITPALLEIFLTSRPRTRARSYNHLLNVLQRLFRWMVAQQVLPRSPVVARARRSTRQRAPYLFEPAQVERLLACAAKLSDGPHTRHRAITYRMIFALMYRVGLRVSEVARFCRKDLDLERRCLHIRQTKFAKSRLVPFGPRMANALQCYLQHHDRHGRASPDDPLFSVAVDGRRPLGSKSISRTFRRLLPELELTVPPGVAPPRLHSLRHYSGVRIIPSGRS